MFAKITIGYHVSLSSSLQDVENILFGTGNGDKLLKQLFSDQFENQVLLCPLTSIY
jgi:hypothetical protein